LFIKLTPRIQKIKFGVTFRNLFLAGASKLITNHFEDTPRGADSHQREIMLLD